MTKNKNIVKPEEVKPEEVKPETNSPNYNTSETKDESGEVPISQEEIGKFQKQSSAPLKKDTVQGLYEKIYYNIHKTRKHYLKFKRDQCEATDPVTGLEIMVYSDDQKECAYFENLSDNEISNYKLF